MTDTQQNASQPGLRTVEADEVGKGGFRYFDFMMTAFVAILLLSNVIGADKAATLGGLKFGAGILFFPLSYLLGDILTEVYGYSRARRCVWAGFAAMIFLALMTFVVVKLPPAPGWSNQQAYELVFGQTGRIVLASICAFWAGEFVNAFVLARMKVWTGGRHLWTRTVSSTVFGQAMDSLIFYPLAFWDAPGFTHGLVITIMVTNWAMKVGWEVLLTPLTYLVVGFLKRAEGVEVFDTYTNFSPFRARL